MNAKTLRNLIVAALAGIVGLGVLAWQADDFSEDRAAMSRGEKCSRLELPRELAEACRADAAGEALALAYVAERDAEAARREAVRRWAGLQATSPFREPEGTYEPRPQKGADLMAVAVRLDVAERRSDIGRRYVFDTTIYWGSFTPEENLGFGQDASGLARAGASAPLDVEGLDPSLRRYLRDNCRPPAGCPARLWATIAILRRDEAAKTALVGYIADALKLVPPVDDAAPASASAP